MFRKLFNKLFNKTRIHGIQYVKPQDHYNVGCVIIQYKKGEDIKDIIERKLRYLINKGYLPCNGFDPHMLQKIMGEA